MPLIIILGLLTVWILPVQLLLSISFQNWKNELSGRFHYLKANDRLGQIKETFEGLDHIQSNKLRLFYIHVSIFHYLLMCLYALSFLLMGFLFLGLGIYYKDSFTVAISLLGFIITCFVGYVLIGILFPAENKKNIDHTLYLFWDKHWRKQIFGNGDQEKIERIIIGSNKVTFYSFWLQGKTLDERKLEFKNFLIGLNIKSKGGILFDFTDEGMVEIIPVVYSSALSKSLAGFLRYCIEDQKVLSDEILHHSHRELLRDVFMLKKLKNLVFLEGQRYKSTPAEYVNVYKSI